MTMSKNGKKVIISGVLVAVAFFIISYLVIPLIAIISLSKKMPKRIAPIKSALVNQEMDLLVFELEYLREDVTKLNSNSQRLKMFSFLPFVGGYFTDIDTICSLSLDMVDTAIKLFGSLEKAIPNVDFKGWEATKEEEAARQTSLTEISNFLSSELPTYKEKVWAMSKKLESIDASRYPESFKGIPVRDYLIQAQSFSKISSESFNDIVALVGIAPGLLGDAETKHYLVFLQNDKELRPSGGTLESYAVFTINRGNLSLAKSGDAMVFDSAKLFYDRPPQYINRYLGLNRFLIRDGAYSPDFKESARAVEKLWISTQGALEVDGVIMLNTSFISSLLDVVGEVEITNGGSLDKNNAKSKLQSLFLLSGSRSQNDKDQKNLIGAFLFEVMRKVFLVPVSGRMELAKNVGKELASGNLLVYLDYQTAEDLLEKYHFSGTVRESEGDYLYISNANVGRDKSNLFVKQSVVYETKDAGGAVTATLTVSYKNNGDYDAALNRGYKNFVQVLVPEGSKIIKSTGFRDFVGNGEGFGKTIFSGYLEVSPKQEAQFSLEYTLPNSDKNYNLLIQKQPGLNDSSYKVTVNGKTEEFVLEKDKVINSQ